MLLEKCSKRGDLMTSQNSENGVPVQAGVQLAVIKEGHFWTSKLCPYGITLGSVDAQCGHQREPKGNQFQHNIDIKDNVAKKMRKWSPRKDEMGYFWGPFWVKNR